MAKTRTIVIDQEALEPWAANIDLIDAALIHHVTIRLTRRARQSIISPAGIPLVWIHYPTVREENWLLDIDDRTLRRRFQKMVRLKILIRRQVALGREKGSRSYYGISEELKTRYEEIDESRKKGKIDRTQMAGLNRIDRPQMASQYERTPVASQYERTSVASHSLSISQSTSLGIPSTSPGQEKPVDRKAARHGLRSVLRGIPGGDAIVAQIEARETRSGKERA